MSEEDDLENIPLLEDIVVTGDLDKAVDSDIDAKDLSSIDSFDELFDANNNEEGNSADAEDPIDAVEPDTTADMFDTSDNQAINDDLFESTQGEIENTKTDALTNNSDDSLQDKPIESLEDYNALIGANDVTDSDSGSEDNNLYEPIDENPTDEIETETINANAETNDSDNQEHVSANGETVQENAPAELNQLIENVIHEIMPALETQIKALVLTSLEKHLSDSSDNDTEFNDSEEP